MRATWRGNLSAWPLSARLLLFCLVPYVLSLAVIGNASLLLSADKALPGVILYRLDARNCFIVHSLTPTTWPAISQAGLRPLDCVLAVDGIAFDDQQIVSAYLASRADGPPSRRFATVDVGRLDGQTFEVEIPVVRFTLTRKLEASLALTVAGLALFGIGLLVLAAQPQIETNRALSAFLLIAGLLVMGALHGFEDAKESIYNLLAVFGGRAFLGPLLWQLAFIFPLAISNKRLLPWRFALYALAPITVVVTALGLFNVLRQTRFAWHRRLDITDDRLVLFMLLLGGGALCARLAWHATRAEAGRTRMQARLLLAALVLAAPITLVDMATYSLRISWFVPRTSNLSFVLWLVPCCALVAYTMLRYQAFAYRGVALDALVVLMVSATLTQIYLFFFVRGAWDGIQFVTMWGAVLLATLFWCVDSPIRRSFRRLFVRHEFDFQITDRFSQQMALASNVDDALARGARSLCNSLEVAWAAIASAHRSQQLWLAMAEEPEQPPLALADGPPEATLPSSPALAHALADGDRPAGGIWLGPRTTAEPIDDEDAKLVALLGQELVRTLAVHAHIENLEQMPGRILAAVESDRNRIGQDLHDSVLQFLGTIPLELDRAGRMVDRDPAQAQTILERTIDQAEIVSQETLASVYDLSPPLLFRQGVIDASHAFAEQACVSHNVRLAWEVDVEPTWRQLQEAQAIQVYRIVQQAVDNALTHADPANLSVRFTQEENDLVVQVIDDGNGFTPATTRPASSLSGQLTTSGLGLVSMQARAKTLAGTLVVRSSPGAGTTILLRFPNVLSNTRPT